VIARLPFVSLISIDFHLVRASFVNAVRFDALARVQSIQDELRADSAKRHFAAQQINQLPGGIRKARKTMSSPLAEAMTCTPNGNRNSNHPTASQ
jgi:hypothetical protein